MLKREVIAAIADLRDDEQIRVKVGDDYYLPVAVSIEPFGTLTSPEGDALRGGSSTTGLTISPIACRNIT